MHFFLAPSPACAQWATRNPDGFVVVIRSRPRAAAQCLHKASCSELTRGIAPHTAPSVRAWACAVDRAELEAWADWEGYSLVYCRECGAEAEKFGSSLEIRSPAAPGLPPAPLVEASRRGVSVPPPVLRNVIPSQEVDRADY
jgi:hypothetical protein